MNTENKELSVEITMDTSGVKKAIENVAEEIDNIPVSINGDPAAGMKEAFKRIGRELVSSSIRPSHYGGSDNPYEARKVIDAWGLDFNLSNVLKYINRHTKKGTPIEDLKKAHQYLTFAIEKLEGR